MTLSLTRHAYTLESTTCSRRNWRRLTAAWRMGRAKKEGRALALRQSLASADSTQVSRSRHASLCRHSSTAALTRPARRTSSAAASSMSSERFRHALAFTSKPQKKLHTYTSSQTLAGAPTRTNRRTAQAPISSPHPRTSVATLDFCYQVSSTRYPQYMQPRGLFVR
jgi:hypothetical protein